MTHVYFQASIERHCKNIVVYKIFIPCYSKKRWGPGPDPDRTSDSLGIGCSHWALFSPMPCVKFAAACTPLMFVEESLLLFLQLGQVASSCFTTGSCMGRFAGGGCGAGWISEPTKQILLFHPPSCAGGVVGINKTLGTCVLCSDPVISLLYLHRPCIQFVGKGWLVKEVQFELAV